MTRKKKAYEYKNFNIARRHGITKKHYRNSVNAKKRWDNLPTLKKDIILENLAKGRAIKKFKLRDERIKRINKDFEDENFVNAYIISSQTHHNTHTQKRIGTTRFEYNIIGTFEHEPNINKIETMMKYTLINLLNGSNIGNAFHNLLDAVLRGVKIEKVRTSKYLITNKISGEIFINNNGNKWKNNN